MDVLKWLEGSGWLVLASEPDALSTIRGMAITRISAEGGVAYIGMSTEDSEDLMNDMNELGAPSGYLVDVLHEEDADIEQQIKEAALVLIPGYFDVEELRAALSGAAINAMKHAYERGAVILAEGNAASLFGAVFVVDNHTVPGFEWVKDAYIVPQVTSITQHPIARELLAADVAKIAVGVGQDSALVLGPVGSVETWGARKITLALNQHAIEEGDADNSLPDLET